MGTQTVTAEVDFNSLQFEKKLTSLKDSQESINACCQWCLQNRQNHKKIVNAWLNVLKRVKVEQRLILFYLANDVVQYSKRRSYEYVESWGTALQKATTLVRDDRVKHKILRIFKIWEQRGVYNEEFISDLCGLISAVPSAPKGDEPHEFQASYVIHKIKTCSNLEKDTDTKLKVLKEHNPKIHIEAAELCASLKDRAHVDDVEKEIEVYVKHMEDYINALKLEIKNRIALISVLKQAETQLESDKKDVKLVSHAYKTFGTRVKTFQKKLEEHRTTLSSPVPSPDINAPSPSPDSDIDLPETDVPVTTSAGNSDYNPSIQYTNAGYYNPVPPPATDNNNSFLTNGFSTFMGSNLPFNLQNLNSTSLFSNTTQTITNTSATVGQPPLPVEAPVQTTASSDYPYSSGHMPLLPPPMPPFSTKADTAYSNSNYSYTNPATTQFDNKYDPTAASYTTSPTNYNASSIYNTTGNASPFNQSGSYITNSFDNIAGGNSYPTGSDDYNPEQDVDTWEPDASWIQSQADIDTPESPPMFEKEGYAEPVEYHDNIQSGAVDVDHRVLPGLSTEMNEDSIGSLGGKDVDHRNLISLTGSPADSNSNIPSGDGWSQSDRDYRPNHERKSSDQDYRLPFNIENLKLPPPPPPPSAQALLSCDKTASPPSDLPPTTKSPRKFQDNVESIDMDLSDDETENSRPSKQNLRVVVDPSKHQNKSFSLEPPPPLPDLPDDVDANNFLDDLSNDLNEFSNLSDDISNHGHWDAPPPSHPAGIPYKNMNTNLPPPPMMGMPSHSNWMGDKEPNPNNWLPDQEDFLQPGWQPDHHDHPPPDWVPPEQFQQRDWHVDQQHHNPNFNFRGVRGMNRGNFIKANPRGRGRGNFIFRGLNNYRGRGAPRGHRGAGGGGLRLKGNFRGNFRGGF